MLQFNITLGTIWHFSLFQTLLISKYCHTTKKNTKFQPLQLKLSHNRTTHKRSAKDFCKVEHPPVPKWPYRATAKRDSSKYCFPCLPPKSQQTSPPPPQILSGCLMTDWHQFKLLRAQGHCFKTGKCSAQFTVHP